MGEVLTLPQEKLIEYFKAIGMTLGETLGLIACLWDIRALTEMWEYLYKTKDTDCIRVIETALKISSEYPVEDEDE